MDLDFDTLRKSIDMLSANVSSFNNNSQLINEKMNNLLKVAHDMQNSIDDLKKDSVALEIRVNNVETNSSNMKSFYERDWTGMVQQIGEISKSISHNSSLSNSQRAEVELIKQKIESERQMNILMHDQLKKKTEDLTREIAKLETSNEENKKKIWEYSSYGAASGGTVAILIAVIEHFITRS